MALASKERFEWDEHVPDKPTPRFDAEPTNASMGLEYAYPQAAVDAMIDADDGGLDDLTAGISGLGRLLAGQRE